MEECEYADRYSNNYAISLLKNQEKKKEEPLELSELSKQTKKSNKLIEKTKKINIYNNFKKRLQKEFNIK